jgi:hypothetical protein
MTCLAAMWFGETPLGSSAFALKKRDGAPPWRRNQHYWQSVKWNFPMMILPRSLLTACCWWTNDLPRMPLDGSPPTKLRALRLEISLPRTKLSTLSYLISAPPDPLQLLLQIHALLATSHSTLAARTRSPPCKHYQHSANRSSGSAWPSAASHGHTVILGAGRRMVSCGY